MGKDNSLMKLMAFITGSIVFVSLFISAAFFGFYKAFNKAIDTLVVDFLDFLSRYGIILSVFEFWFIFGVIFILLAVIIIVSSD